MFVPLLGLTLYRYQHYLQGLQLSTPIYMDHKTTVSGVKLSINRRKLIGEAYCKVADTCYPYGSYTTSRILETIATHNCRVGIQQRLQAQKYGDV